MCRFAALLLLLIHASWGQTRDEERRKQNPGLFQIVERARTVSAEFAAATLIQVAASPMLTDKVWKKELLEEAFRLASMARYPIRKRMMANGTNQASDAGMMSLAYEQKLDRISLESRAVTQMLSVDSSRAREMFLGIPLPRIAALTCRDALLDDPSDYYETLAKVSAGTYGESLRERDAQLDWLRASIQRISSAVEVPLMGNALLQSGVSQQQLEILLTFFAGALDRIRGDDRAFSSSLRLIDSTVANLSSPAVLVSYRGFLVGHLNAPRCGESVPMSDEVERLIGRFNSRFANSDNPGLAALRMEELKPASTGDTATVELLFDKPEFQTLRSNFSDLFIGRDKRVISDEQKNTPQWKDQFQGYIATILDMKPATGERETTFFHRKGQAISSALALVPQGAERDKAVTQYIAFLQNSNLQQENFLVWFDQVVKLAESTRSLRGAEHLKFLEALEATGHPVLSLYALRERTLGSRPRWAN